MLQLTDDVAPYDIPFEAYGVQARICANSPELLARVEPFLPPGYVRCPPTPVQDRLGVILEDDGTYTVYNGQVPVSMGQGLELSLIMLEGQIRGHVALKAPERTFVHAGAVAHEGRAMIFPGLTFAGKTTLVAALVRAGAIYYSDEFAVLDEDGLLHPYAKPLSLRDDPGVKQVDQHVTELGGVAGEEPLPVGLVVVTVYRPGAEWHPRSLSAGEAALALMSNTVTARTRPKEALRAVTRAVDGAVAVESERGDAAELAGHLLAGVHA